MFPQRKSFEHGNETYQLMVPFSTPNNNQLHLSEHPAQESAASIAAAAQVHPVLPSTTINLAFFWDVRSSSDMKNNMHIAQSGHQWVPLGKLDGSPLSTHGL